MDRAKKKLLVTVIGPPASGKGFHCSLLTREYPQFLHVSTGDMLRKEIASRTPLGLRIQSIIDKGNFVDDETMSELIFKRLSEEEKTLVLDGFPRTLRQAEKLEDMIDELELELRPILFDAPKPLLIKRAVGRRVHIPSGRVYNIFFNKPKVDGLDDVTGEELVHRPDDTEEIFEQRYKTFLDLTLPVAKKYEKQGILTVIQTGRHPPDVFEEFKKAVGL